MRLDFQQLKERVDIVNVVDMLGLEMVNKGEQLRGACPRCNDGGDRALVVTPSKGVYFCFVEGRGGDLISLASHILDVNIRTAAVKIAEHFDLTEAELVKENDNVGTVPPKPQEEGERTLQPLGYLHHDLPCILDLHITEEEAKAVGIGFAKRGMMKDRICFPIRMRDGKLVGYAGYDPADGTLKLPPKGLFI
jgi:DNA primase